MFRLGWLWILVGFCFRITFDGLGLSCAAGFVVMNFWFVFVDGVVCLLVLLLAGCCVCFVVLGWTFGFAALF